MSQHASQVELNKFVKVVDEFKLKYARLILPSTRQQVYASKNAQLISNYESVLIKSQLLDKAVNVTVGAWNAYKRGTASTSMMIGDAVDTIRSWFGYRPAGPDGNLSAYHASGLGAIQLVGAATIAGIIGTAIVVNKMITQIFITLEANRLQKEDPTLDRYGALQKAKASTWSILPTGVTPLMLGFGGIALYLMFGGERNR